jgi:hypothetical protein
MTLSAAVLPMYSLPCWVELMADRFLITDWHAKPRVSRRKGRDHQSFSQILWWSPLLLICTRATLRGVEEIVTTNFYLGRLFQEGWEALLGHK